MTKLSIYLAVLLLLSLPLKVSYFADDISQEAEVAERKKPGQDIVELLLADRFTIEREPTDSFLPSVVAVKQECRLYIAPIPVLKDLDAAFLFESRGYGDAYAYYYDGHRYSEPPIYSPRFWEFAARHFPKIGIPIELRLRVGVSYSSECPIGGVDLTRFTARMISPP